MTTVLTAAATQTASSPWPCSSSPGWPATGSRSAVRPYTNCRRCNGGGKDRGEVFTRAYRHCRHCDGTGRTLRLGARLFRTTGNRR